MNFTPQDLGVSQDMLDQITAQLANADNPDPIGDSIARQIQRVSDYTLRYDVPDERVKRLVKPLVIWDLYSNPALGPLPPNAKAAYDDAMQELKDIRDGKFTDLKLKEPADPNLAQAHGEWGSEDRASFRRDGGQA